MSAKTRFPLLFAVGLLLVGVACAQPAKPVDFEVNSLGVAADKLPRETVAYTSKDAGCTFRWGAIDLGANPEAMMIVRGTFPDPSKFIRFSLDYYGPFTDSGTGIKGEMFSGMVVGKKRWFLIGNEGGAQRDFLVYNADGKVLFRDVVDYAKK